MMNVYPVIIALAAGISAAGTAWYIGWITRQITYVTLADGRRQERRLPLSMRLLLPFASNLTRWFDGAAWEATRRDLHRDLVASGYQDIITPHELLAMRILMPLVFGVGLSALLHLALIHLPGRIGILLLDRQLVGYALLLLTSILYPGLWLRHALRQRHHQIERALPFVLDLLTLSVEAGVDFMTGIRRIVERREMDALGEELMRAFRQIQVGKTRRDALREMARRVNNPDVYSVVNALVQADEMGTGIATALRIQADQMRTRRYQRAEKLANEAPVKLLFPLIAFIFPAVFIVLMGPVLMELLRQGI